MRENGGDCELVIQEMKNRGNSGSRVELKA